MSSNFGSPCAIKVIPPRILIERDRKPIVYENSYSMNQIDSVNID
jgi:hypothetical protein